MSKIKFGGSRELVISKREFSLTYARKILKNETVAVLGYGKMGSVQALNLRDNGIKVIIGQRKPSLSWNKALNDGFLPGKDLFSIEEAAKRGTIISFLLSDSGQVEVWPKIKKYLSSGKALNFSHGFALTFSDKTKIIPPKNIDVFMVAPKGAGRSVRENFLKGSGINSGFAVFQDASGKARDRCLALGMAIGSGYLFETSFKMETFSDLVSERGVLLGALTGVMEAQYNELRRQGHNPSEAFNDTVEELTQNIIPLIAEKGMDFLYANCSTTAQRGAFDWKGEFRKAVEPVFKKLYRKVKSGQEAERVLKANRQPDYRQKLEKELNTMRNSEMWRVGVKVRNLRPKKNPQKINKV